jgi:outer membrane scaffolding protein for murein synthesis (MipA/OmpV family)
MRALVLLVSLLLAPSALPAEQLPLWELGFGGGVIRIPDYRGSDEAGVYPYPFVMPVYRGRVLQADEEGIKGVLGESSRFRFDLSFYGNVPVSNDNDARKGMDDLAPTLELGPMLRYKPWQTPAHQQSIIFDVPVRAAIAVGGGVEYVGFGVTPRLSYRRALRPFGPYGGDRDWKWSISGEVLWGSGGLHRYYYQVDPADATATRPAYDAEAGYGGTRFRSSIYRRDPNKLISFYAVYDDVSGAVFDDSPLVRQQGGLTIGFVVTWFLAQSDELVDVRQWEWSND